MRPLRRLRDHPLESAVAAALLATLLLGASEPSAQKDQANQVAAACAATHCAPAELFSDARNPN